jgi:hypothetical protein
VRWAGAGAELWWVRVEQFVEGDSSEQFTRPAAAALSTLLHTDDGGPGPEGADQGTGMASPVVGLVFLVRADDPAQATATAVETAGKAMEESTRGLYGVTVIRQSAAPAPIDSDFPVIGD